MAQDADTPADIAPPGEDDSLSWTPEATDSATPPAPADAAAAQDDASGQDAAAQDVASRSEVSVIVSTLGSAALAGPSSLPTALLATVGDSANLPVIDGMKLSLQFQVELFTGTYGASDETRQSVFDLHGPTEIELTNATGHAIDLQAFGDPVTPPEGLYTHGGVSLQDPFKLKAHFRSGGNTVYTTAAGLRTLEGDRPGEDYDYQAFTSLYDDPVGDGAYETTFFELPFAHDGTSPLAINLLFDLNRAGYFTSSGVEADFKAYPPNLYVTFNAVGVSSVETYLLSDTEDGLGFEGARSMTLVFTERGTLIGGRTRGLLSNLYVGQFIRDWRCEDTDEGPRCSFQSGDYGSGRFPYSGVGFARTQPGDPPRTFEFSDSVSMTTVPLHYVRVAR